jgi:myo-inositol-1(or 4)-monophosphatase
MDFEQAVITANRQIFELLAARPDASFFRPADESAAGIGAGGDRSLKIDLEAEAIFITHLRDFGRIDSEECGPVGEGADEIVIDPIDGSSNIASGFPYYGTSVSLKKGGRPHISIVCNLANGDYFVRSPKGAYRANLLSSDRHELVTTENPSIGLFEKAYAYPAVVSGLSQLRMKFRSPGAVALSLAYAHSVHFVLFVGVFREYDIIAGLHLCENLHTFVREDVVLVSRERQTYEAIKELLIKG